MTVDDLIIGDVILYEKQIIRLLCIRVKNFLGNIIITLQRTIRVRGSDTNSDKDILVKEAVHSIIFCP